MMEVNIALSSRHFQNGGNIMTNLYFWGRLLIQCMENTIVIDPVDIGSPIGAYRRPQLVEFKL